MEIKIKNVKKVKLEPGDTLVFELEEQLSKVIIVRQIQELKNYFPEQKILVLSKGIILKEVLTAKNVVDNNPYDLNQVAEDTKNLERRK